MERHSHHRSGSGAGHEQRRSRLCRQFQSRLQLRHRLHLGGQCGSGTGDHGWHHGLGNLGFQSGQ